MLGRRGTVVVVSLVAILLLPLAAAAQTESEAPDASPGTSPSAETGDRCAAWQTTPDLAQRQGRLAARSGAQFPGAALNVDVEEIPTACTLSSANLEELGDAGAFFTAFGITNIFQAGDGVSDAIALNGNDPASPDPNGPDLVSIFFGRTAEMTRRESMAARFVVEKLRNVTFGLPGRQWLNDGGAFELTYLRGFVPSPVNPHAFEVGFMGAKANKTIPATLTDIDPLTGVQKLVTFYSYTLAGEQRTSVHLSDFGSKKVGPDGRTQFYNVPATAFGAIVNDGVILGYPARLDPLGMRPMISDNITGTFDHASAPDGPMSFIPSSGSAPSIFDAIGPFVLHTPTSAGGVVIDGGAPQVFNGRSLGGGIFSSRLFRTRKTQPVLDVTFDVGGHTYAFESLPGVGSGSQFAYTWPIPQQGLYTYRGLQLRWSDGLPLDDPWSEALRQLDAAPLETARVIGAQRFTVDQKQGSYNPPFKASTIDELAAELARRLGIDPRD